MKSKLILILAILGIACLGQTVLVSANGVWDGNFLLFFYKSPAHSSPYCGNGITQPEFGEQCDFNSLFPLADPWWSCNSLQICNTSCLCSYCGNGFVDSGLGEICDPAANPCCLDDCSGYLTEGTSCDDGLFCTTADACDGSGVCSGAARNCSDSIGCTDDTCNETADSCENAVNDLNCNPNGTCDDSTGYIFTGVCDLTQDCLTELAPAETCDDLDNDCDGTIDNGFDLDSDTYYNETRCLSTSHPLDCNDSDASINPGATELCDGIDNDCDSSVDEGCDCIVGQTKPCGITDVGECEYGLQTCDINGVWGTCVGNIDPIAESCNGLDDDCDGNIDNGVLITYYQDSDSDSYGNASATTDACSQPTGYVSDNTDCDDSDADKNPGEIEVCDGKDNDCDGSVDEGFNNESCSYTCIDEGYNWTSSNVCCGNDAGEANPYQTNETACDSNDNDCDGSVDEGCQCSPPGILQECGTNVGECSTGNQTCLGNYTWGICENETAPVTEDCNDTLDNDCDGFADANDSNCWICGNGIVDQNEECEFDENCTGSQYCSNCDCKSTGGGGGGGHTVTTGTGTSVCGNGIINTGELCDKEVGCAYGYECSINCLQCIKTGTNETVVEIEEEETYYFSGCSYTVLESNGNYVYLEINCEGRKQQLTLTTEQGLEIDSDGDGSVDTYITLHGFTNDRADIGFRSIEKVSYRPPFTLTTEAMALVFLLIMGGILALFYFASKGFFGNAGAKKKKK